MQRELITTSVATFKNACMKCRVWGCKRGVCRGDGRKARPRGRAMRGHEDTTRREDTRGICALALRGEGQARHRRPVALLPHGLVHAENGVVLWRGGSLAVSARCLARQDQRKSALSGGHGNNNKTRRGNGLRALPAHQLRCLLSAFSASERQLRPEPRRMNTRLRSRGGSRTRL